MYLMFYPRNDVSCAWIFFFRVGTFYLSSYWMILLWLLFDIWGAVQGSGGVGYWAHLGGFAAGAGGGALALKRGWITMRSTEESLLEMLSGNKRSSLR